MTDAGIHADKEVIEAKTYADKKMIDADTTACNTMIAINGLCTGYNGVDVIHDINLKADIGECLCVLGPNGCGKSTLLKAIAGILNYRGTVRLEGVDTSTCSRRELAKKIAMLGQEVQIYFPFSVYQTVSLGRYAHSKSFLSNLSAEDRAIIDDTIKSLDIWDVRDKMIDELSGGQLQRVLLAMTIAQNPQLILLDEPTSHLDLKYQIDLLNFLKKWVKENNKTLVGVFHDLNMARNFSDTAILINKGQITASGTVDEVLDGEALNAAYGMDIRKFMAASFQHWRL
ncbi:MAG: ABC transporter ATP-binding protein [Treponema sp.]|jgi:iron complex transport system ATP-binding protein|nr:ABC transporter ATP-binding protein [Treponema sp.]